MSAIAVIGGEARRAGQAAAASAAGDGFTDSVRAALSAMRARGDSAPVIAELGPVTMAAIAHAWQRPVECAQVGQITVVADATLYYRDDLARRVGGAVRASEMSDARLIAACWALRGADALAWLEGDFALAVWDAARGTLTVARDPVGTRSVYFAWHAGALRVASTIAGVLADGVVPRTLDLATVASVGGGLWSHPAATAYAQVTELRAGELFTWRPGSAPTVHEWWHPPMEMLTRRRPLDPAADELRALLASAVRERLSPDSTTAVSLSGGWDSTAVYASGCAISDRVHGVSISYPPGDPGREDETIALVTARWGTTPDFIPSAEIPLFVDTEAAAARRDQPFAHVYEHWNRALSRRARAAGARVILDGVGGDNLFQASPVYLAELFRTLQWGELLAQWRIWHDGLRDWRGLYRSAVLPGLPRWVQELIARGRGGRVQTYLDRFPPIWFRQDFLRAHQVRERDRAAQPSLPDGNLLRRETHVFLRFPFFQRIYAHLHAFGLEEGLELRSPLIDQRIVQFAARRPWSDRADGKETKRLLRRAMRDLLPAEVLAPRPHRTGTTNAYFVRQMREAGWPIAERTLRDSRLAALGMIDPAVLRDGWTHLLQHDDSELAGRLFFTLQAELWMRTQSP